MRPRCTGWAARSSAPPPSSPNRGRLPTRSTRQRQKACNTFAHLVDRTSRDLGLLDMVVALYDGAMTSACLGHHPGIVDHAPRGADVLLRRATVT